MLARLKVSQALCCTGISEKDSRTGGQEDGRKRELEEKTDGRKSGRKRCEEEA